MQVHMGFVYAGGNLTQHLYFSSGSEASNPDCETQVEDFALQTQLFHKSFASLVNFGKSLGDGYFQTQHPHCLAQSITNTQVTGMQQQLQKERETEAFFLACWLAVPN